MKNNDYENLCARMTSGPQPVEKISGFSILCMSAGVSSKEADNRLYDDFGMSGEELLRALESPARYELL